MFEAIVFFIGALTIVVAAAAVVVAVLNFCQKP